MSSLDQDCLVENPAENFPAAISSLIDGAVAALDADPAASRRYLLRASALLQAKRRGRAGVRASVKTEFRGGLAPWQLHRLVDHIESRLADRIAIEDLADRFNFSVGHFFRAFKVSVGVSPARYIVGRRLERACLMLKTTREPLSQIALACGLCDQSHLCRVFRQVLGMSPASWRRTYARMPVSDRASQSISMVRMVSRNPGTRPPAP